MAETSVLPQEQTQGREDETKEDLSQRTLGRRVLSALQFYFSQGIKEIKLRTCSFIWGFLSITLVCLVTSVVISVSDKLPVIILMLAENTAGEVDLQISPGTWTDRYALNSTQAKQILEQLGDDYSQMPQNEFFGDFYAIDSEQEEHIQIGREWIYGKIPRGACIITESFANQLKVKKDDEIQFIFSVANFTSIAADVIDQYAQRSMPLMMELLSAVPIKLIIYEVADSVEKNGYG
ncbi:MAG: hypothetical protein EZS28_014894 [Streblomastix strix]|uniref:Uncharacterized protein n=1 Tax=Streblomastix strix TaxID=222440 RepID=A0A5J4W3T6_9EUKA|nr:MAG: hypothetical protein EZS28_014894 [Streblomastix strix]